MKLHFLGTTGYHPNNQRQTACMMLPEIGVILDAGTGIFRARDLIQTDHLDVFLSHVHLDHCVGLTFLYDVLWEKEVSVTVHVAAEKIKALEEALFHKDLFPVKPNFAIQPLQPITKLAGGQKLTAIEVEHPGGAHAFRIDFDDRSIAYVTDTVADEHASYVQAITGVQTLLHECYFPDGWEDRAELTGHSCLTPVAKVAALAKAERLFLVHINPLNESSEPLDLESVKGIFADIEVASDQQVIDV
ncbi:MBL fold metallo-hydrolase [Mariniblastus sp.]|nr:MBL fold metallo-hydrolase [Mariniblastus sp.]